MLLARIGPHRERRRWIRYCFSQMLGELVRGIRRFKSCLHVDELLFACFTLSDVVTSSRCVNIFSLQVCSTGLV